MALQKKYQPQAMQLQKQMLDLQKQMQALNAKVGTEAQPIMQARQKEVDAVLTAQQKAKIKQMQDAQMQMMRQQQMGGAATLPH